MALNRKKIKQRHVRRRLRIRQSIKGTAERPRLSLYKSNKYIYLQVIDDFKGVTLAASDSRKQEGTKEKILEAMVEKLSNQAQKKGITQVVFDRNIYLYHGVVKKISQLAVKKGLKH